KSFFAQAMEKIREIAALFNLGQEESQELKASVISSTKGLESRTNLQAAVNENFAKVTGQDPAMLAAMQQVDALRKNSSLIGGNMKDVGDAGLGKQVANVSINNGQQQSGPALAFS